MARPTRFERVASTFGGWRSIQLSYGRIDIQIVSETERGQSRIEQMHRRQTGRVLNLPNFAVRPLQPPLSLLPWRFRDLWMRLHASVEFRQSIGFARIFRPAHTSKRACLCLRRAALYPAELRVHSRKARSLCMRVSNRTAHMHQWLILIKRRKSCRKSCVTNAIPEPPAPSARHIPYNRRHIDGCRPASAPEPGSTRHRENVGRAIRTALCPHRRQAP